jgi:hypothetical protein
MLDEIVSLPEGLLDRRAAEEAMALARPSIEAVLARPGASGERVLHVVVMNPQLTPTAAPFERAVLYEASIGNPATWGADYRAFARAKAQLAWRLGRDTHAVQEQMPYLLRRGDTLLWGGVTREGITVACSGAHPWFDEACAGIVVSLLAAIAQGRARAARERGLVLE